MPRATDGTEPIRGAGDVFPLEFADSAGYIAALTIKG